MILHENKNYINILMKKASQSKVFESKVNNILNIFEVKIINKL